MSRHHALFMSIAFAGACAGDDGAVDLAHRAYVVSQQSEELTVIDTEEHRVIGQVATRGISNHMAEVSADLESVFVVSSSTDEIVVIDARSLAITARVPVAGHPTHISSSRDGRLIAVVAEDYDEVVFLDPATATVTSRVSGMVIPHFVRWSEDGASAYVANIGGHHVTRVDLATMTIAEQIVLDGFTTETPAPEESGFADVQIDRDGVLWAAHSMTGRLLAYDTRANRKLAELPVGEKPWIAFAEHPFAEVPLRHLVPSFGDRLVRLVDGVERAVVTSLPGDEEAYGVNYSSQTPDLAFVMNRVRADVAVVDTARREVVKRIPVGGNTETAATTADGRWIIATVSGADRVAVIDPVSQAVVETIDGVGSYPWSVTIPGGQNYCH